MSNETKTLEREMSEFKPQFNAIFSLHTDASKQLEDAMNENDYVLTNSVFAHALIHFQDISVREIVDRPGDSAAYDSGLYLQRLKDHLDRYEALQALWRDWSRCYARYLREAPHPAR